MLYAYTLETPAENLCPITAQVQGAVAESGAFVLEDFSRNTFPCIFAKCDFLYGTGRSQRR